MRTHHITSATHHDGLQDTDGIYDRVEFKYNRQREAIWKKDQNRTIHEYDYAREIGGHDTECGCLGESWLSAGFSWVEDAADSRRLLRNSLTGGSFG